MTSNEPAVLDLYCKVPPLLDTQPWSEKEESPSQNALYWSIQRKVGFGGDPTTQGLSVQAVKLFFLYQHSFSFFSQDFALRMAKHFCLAFLN